MSLIKGNHAGLGGSGAPGGALGSFFSSTIDNSVRLVGNSTAASSARLTQTFGTVDSATDFTLNFWIKRNEILNPVNSGYPQFIFNFRDGTSGTALNDLCFLASGSYGVGASLVLTATNSASYILSTNNLFRDFSAWYNIHIMGDLNNGTASEKLKFFINGVEASYATDNRGSYTSLVGLKAGAWTIGDYYGYSYPTGSSIARWAFVDNSTLAASYFGEFKDGVWIPKALAGITWGSAGHLLEFGATGTSQNSSGIGADTSGETNHWAVANIAASDVLPDSPTNNFATLNPLSQSTTANWTLSEGNLHCAAPSSNGWQSVRGTHGVSSGKWYWEVEFDAGTMTEIFCGIMNQNTVPHATSDFDDTTGVVLFYNHVGGEIRYNNTLTGNDYGTLSAGDILGVALNMDDKQLSFYKNGSAIVTNFDINITGITTVVPAAASDGYSVVLKFNFGQDSANVSSANADDNGIGTFEYAPPSGFLALCTSNLPDITIGPGQTSQADDYFNTVLYTGNATDATAISGVGFSPDWTWIKVRNNTNNHRLFDTARGAGKDLISNSTSAESTTTTRLQSFDSDGFTVGTNAEVNSNGHNIVAWNWNAGGAPTADNSAGNGATPTAGSVKIDGSNLGSALAGSLAATRLSANTTAGFSIVTWTAASDSGTVAHGLTSAPEMIIAKPLGDGTNWYVMHTPGSVVPANNVLNLDSTAAAFNPGVNHFNDTYPTSTVFSFGGYLGDDLSNDDKVAYCFHSVEGFSAIGSFIGNGDDSGPFVYTGFRPAWVMIKRVDAANDWHIMDDQRNPINVMDGLLFANLTTIETSDAAYNRDFLSNGFKIRGSEAYVNASGGTFVYMAFAHSPYKFANAFRR